MQSQTLEITSLNGKTYNMPWSKTEDPSEDEIKSFIASQEVSAKIPPVSQEKAPTPARSSGSLDLSKSYERMNKGVLPVTKVTNPAAEVLYRWGESGKPLSALEKAYKYVTSSMGDYAPPGVGPLGNIVSSDPREAEMQAGAGVQAVGQATEDMTSPLNLTLGGVGEVAGAATRAAGRAIPAIDELTQGIIAARSTGNSQLAEKLAGELAIARQTIGKANAVRSVGRVVQGGAGAGMAGNAAYQGVVNKDPSQILPFALGAMGAYHGVVPNKVVGNVKPGVPPEIPVVSRQSTPGDYAMDNAYTRARGGEVSPQMQALSQVSPGPEFAPVTPDNGVNTPRPTFPEPQTTYEKILAQGGRPLPEQPKLSKVDLINSEVVKEAVKAKPKFTLLSETEGSLINPNKQVLEQASKQGWSISGHNPDGSLRLVKETLSVQPINPPEPQGVKPVTPINRPFSEEQKVSDRKGIADRLLKMSKEERRREVNKNRILDISNENTLPVIDADQGKLTKPLTEKGKGNLVENPWTKSTNKELDEAAGLIEKQISLRGKEPASFQQALDYENLKKEFEARGREWPKTTKPELGDKLKGMFGKGNEKGEVSLSPEHIKKIQEAFGEHPVVNTLGAFKSAMAGADLSAPLRQGRLLSHKKEFWTSLKPMLQAARSEHGYNKVMGNVVNNEHFDLGMKSKLALTDVGEELSDREEAIMSNLPEKIPGIGKLYRGSNRAYTAFLNKLRMDTFASMINDAKAMGRSADDKELTDSIANFINNATGRGSLHGLEGASKSLNAIFFSPRFVASRLAQFNPVEYARMDPMVRKEAIKSILAYTASQAAVLGLASLAGAKVEHSDMTNADFGKIRIGNTRIDTTAGLGPYTKFAAQLAQGKINSSTTGKDIKLNTGKFGAPTRLDTFEDFLINRAAPIPSYIAESLRGKTSGGDPLNFENHYLDKITPMLYQDLRDIYRDDPRLLPLGLLSALGAGVQTYHKKASKTSPFAMPKMK